MDRSRRAATSRRRRRSAMASSGGRAGRGATGPCGVSGRCSAGPALDPSVADRPRAAVPLQPRCAVGERAGCWYRRPPSGATRMLRRRRRSWGTGNAPTHRAGVVRGSRCPHGCGPPPDTPPLVTPTRERGGQVEDRSGCASAWWGSVGQRVRRRGRDRCGVPAARCALRRLRPGAAPRDGQLHDHRRQHDLGPHRDRCAESGPVGRGRGGGRPGRSVQHGRRSRDRTAGPDPRREHVRLDARGR